MFTAAPPRLAVRHERPKTASRRAGIGIVLDAARDDPHDCRHGSECIKFGCPYNHPKGRPGDCFKGIKCSNAGCRYIHPKGRPLTRRHKHDTDHSRQLARPGSCGANFSATFRLDDGNGRHESLSVSVQRKPLCFVVGVDASASMEGSKTDAAIAGLG